MQKFIQTLALLAAVLTLATGLWQGWAFPVTLKKLILAYMGIFFTGSLMVLAIRLAGEFETKGAPGGRNNKNKVGNKP